MVNFQLILLSVVSGIIAIVSTVIFVSVQTTFSENLGNAGGLFDIFPLIFAMIALLTSLVSMVAGLASR